MKILTGILLIILAAGGCNEDTKDNGGETGETGISVSPEILSVPSSEESYSITVTSSDGWGVSVDDASWCSVFPSGGAAGTSTISVSVSENTGDDVREATLTFRTSKGSMTYTVIQNYSVVETVISDPAFKSYLIENFDTDGDGVLNTREAAAITEINASGLGIEAMPEINTAFPNLVKLDCSDNAISELNLSGLTALTWLDCSNNRLTELDISQLYNLVFFDASGNPDLTAIYVWTGFTAGENFSKPNGAEYIEPEIETPLGYVLVWQDEFNSSDTGMPDTANWWYETADPGWVNNELQTYVAGSVGDIVVAEVSDGSLKIHAIKEGTRIYSARMNTVECWTYGYFEARLKLPSGLGTWPAFWMMPEVYTVWPACGELDIMEHVGADLNEVSSSVHCQSYYHVTGNQPTEARYLAGATEDFHVYALEWTEEYIKTYVDGELLLYYNPEEFGSGVRDEDSWPFHVPFMLKLNLAWGGDWGGYKGVDESCLPQTYEIDYVRVFQKAE